VVQLKLGKVLRPKSIVYITENQKYENVNYENKISKNKKFANKNFEQQGNSRK
jgi:hypothetical protein